VDADTADILTITSTRGPDDDPVCEIAWKGDRWYAPVADVRATALDLVTCAAYAEMMMHLITVVNLPPSVVAALVTDLLASQGRKRFGTVSTVELLPAGSSKAKTAVVLIIRKQRGFRHDGMVDAAEARKMALRFLEAAEATESDQLLSEALRAAGVDRGRRERVFGYLRELRR
jgi:hypothetical protein